MAKGTGSQMFYIVGKGLENKYSHNRKGMHKNE